MGFPRSILQCVAVALLLLPVEVCGGIYFYIDQNGVKHFTNTPTDSRFRPARLPRLNTPAPDGKSYSGEARSRNTAFVYNPRRYDRQIAQAAEKHKLDPLLIKAIIKVESDFNPNATSSKGAQGLMQLMPATANELQVWNPYNATENINGGVRYFKKLFDAYGGDVTRSLAAYNAGPGRVKKDGPLPMIAETRNYIQKVIRYYQLYRRTNTASSS
jgi:soluble lytic murein transglycosylase-like protein